MIVNQSRGLVRLIIALGREEIGQERGYDYEDETHNKACPNVKFIRSCSRWRKQRMIVDLPISHAVRTKTVKAIQVLGRMLNSM